MAVRPNIRQVRIAPGAAWRLTDVAQAAAQAISVWRLRRRTRAHLSDLDPKALRDVGLTDTEARTEARKPFWRE